MDNYIESLKGITYQEWIKLRTGIDRAFEQQKSESEHLLKLADTKTVKLLIQSQFGQT